MLKSKASAKLKRAEMHFLMLQTTAVSSLRSAMGENSTFSLDMVVFMFINRHRRLLMFLSIYFLLNN